MLEFRIKKEIDGLEMHFNSHIENIDRAVETIMEYVRTKRVLVNCFDLNVVIRELLSNAVIHGNHSDPGKKVSLKLLTDVESLVIIVKDEGQGFNPVQTVKRIDALVQNGMGLTIIKSLGYRLRYCKKEQSVYAEKDLQNDTLKN
jgi:serine/threonine-protein kinase RsbW